MWGATLHGHAFTQRCVNLFTNSRYTSHPSAYDHEAKHVNWQGGADEALAVTAPAGQLVGGVVAASHGCHKGCKTDLQAHIQIVGDANHVLVL